MQYYLLLKMLHIFGVVLFLGNIVVTAFWKTFSDFSIDWRVIVFSQRLVTYTDIAFTTLGVLMIASTGMLMAKQYGNFFDLKWIMWGFSLFVASGVIWLFILIPLQVKLHQIANQFKSNAKIPAIYWKLERYWMIFGMIATVLPLITLYWMVFKPV